MWSRTFRLGSRGKVAVGRWGAERGTGQGRGHDVEEEVGGGGDSKGRAEGVAGSRQKMKSGKVAIC